MSGVIACDVLVVGAGPTGATLALLLARNGVRTLLIDKETEIYALPRAAHIDHEIVRIFQELGVAEAIMATCRSSKRYDFVNARGDILLRFEGIDRLATGGWPAGNMIHQPSIERALREAISNEADLTFRTGWSFRSFHEIDGAMRSEISTPDGPVTVSSRYVVGADGARSPVRACAGIAFDDLEFDEPWLVIDTIVHDASRLPEANLQICDPARPTTCVLMGAGRHRWEFMIKPGETADEVSDNAFVAKLLEPWNVEGAVTMERKAVYRFSAGVATEWRKRAVFLAGDAAHKMPPFAGQGLCSGLRDAANLAWKLGAIITNSASESLLDTYQPEREPNVRAIIGMAIMMGRTVCITDPCAAAKRDERMLAARAAGASPDGTIRYPPIDAGCVLRGAPAAGSYFPQPLGGEPIRRLDDVIGPGAWLITRGADTCLRGIGNLLSERSADEACLAVFRDHLIKWLVTYDAEAVLVRPDRYVFGAGNAGMLREAWARKVA